MFNFSVGGPLAAHLMVLHLCDVPIAAEITGGDVDFFYEGDFAGLDESAIPRRNTEIALPFLGARMFARWAGHSFEEIEHRVERGRRYLRHGLPDRPLTGYCDGNGNVLASRVAIVARAKQGIDEILAKVRTPEQIRHHFAREPDNLDPRDPESRLTPRRDDQCRLVIGHFYLAIIELAASLRGRSAILGKQDCPKLIETALARYPANSFSIRCACHVEPKEPNIARFVSQREPGLQEG